MAIAYPVIGDWYRRSNGTLLKIVAADEEDATIEIQFFDGTIDEVDFETWNSMMLERVGAPEDWSGEIPLGYHDPLSFLDKTD
jgi:hypothetical protein